MIFWLGILFGALFVYIAVKMGFFQTWAMLFNIAIAIYLAVFLGPLIAGIVPATDNTSYNNAIAMTATAIASFLILYGLAYVFFTSQFSVTFPRILDVLGSGFLGFFTGLLVWAFIVLLIQITPISQNKVIENIGLAGRYEKTQMPYISWWCELVNKIAAEPDGRKPTLQIISSLLSESRKKSSDTGEKEPITDNPADSNQTGGETTGTETE